MTSQFTTAVATLATAVYLYAELIGWSVIAWILWIVYVVVREVRRPVEDTERAEDGPKPTKGTPTAPLPDSRATDSDRYTSLMPIIATLEVSPAIAERGAGIIDEVHDDGDTFTVSGTRDYEVALDPISCSCPWWTNRGTVCKHIVAVAGYVLARVEG